MNCMKRMPTGPSCKNSKRDRLQREIDPGWRVDINSNVLFFLSKHIVTIRINVKSVLSFNINIRSFKNFMITV